MLSRVKINPRKSEKRDVRARRFVGGTLLGSALWLQAPPMRAGRLVRDSERKDLPIS